MKISRHYAKLDPYARRLNGTLFDNRLALLYAQIHTFSNPVPLEMFYVLDLFF